MDNHSFRARPFSVSVEVAVLSALLLLFLGITGFRLYSPGFYFDAIPDEARALSWAESLRAGRFHFLSSWGAMPLYHGNLTSYFLFPVFYLLGPQWTLIRLWPIFWGMLTLISTYLLVRRAFDVPTAAGTVFLLAIHPAFAMGIKVGQYYGSLMLFFSTTGLLLFLRAWQEKSAVSWALAIFVSSLGLGTRLWYSWFLIGLCVCGLAFSGHLWRRFNLGDTSRRRWFVYGGIVALLPMSVMIIYGLMQRGYADISGTLHPQSLENPCRQFLRLTHQMLLGLNAYNYYFNGAAPSIRKIAHSPLNTLYPPVFWVSLLWCALRPVIKPAHQSRGPLTFLVLLFISMMGAAAFTFKFRAFAHHYIVFYPLYQIIIVVALKDILQRSLRYPLLTLLIVGSSVQFILSETYALTGFMRRVSIHGGLNKATDRIYDLSDQIDRYAIKNRSVPILTSYYVAQNLSFLNAGSDIRAGDDPDALKLLLGGTPRFAYILSHWDTEQAGLPTLRSLSMKHGYSINRLHRLHDKDGSPVFDFFELTRDSKD
ncbi:MAG TPA: glycosyltransferase family 39 protein [Elusimicrobiota bacterium]|nr:glycosyltransferase family 39 protein [Elusimicrobiota bacterium]